MVVVALDFCPGLCPTETFTHKQNGVHHWLMDTVLFVPSSGSLSVGSLSVR